MILYPAIDLLGGRVVRLLRGRFDQRTVYAHDPVALARSLAERGARHLHVVDLDGTRDGVLRQSATIEALFASGLRVQVGGGIRTLDEARAYVEAGAAAVVVGSLAVRDPARCEELIEALGPARVRLALDCRLDDAGVPRVVTHGWAVQEQVTVHELLARYADLGLESFLCTDVECDGTLAGPNVALYAELKQRFPDIGVIASGGVGDLADLERLRAAGADGAILGRALLDGRVDLAAALALEDSAC